MSSSTEATVVARSKIKVEVRMAKFGLRGVSFSCSLIVVAMMSTVLTMFDATKVHQGASHAQRHARLVRDDEPVAADLDPHGLVPGWIATAASFQHQRNINNNKDMWGWSWDQTPRAETFEDDVNYSLLCRLQDWTSVCIIIEIVVDVVTVGFAVMRIVDAIVLRTVQNSAATPTVAVPIPARCRSAAV
ncbi:hypothetical protein MCOR02_012056 [Pyricularia oryzae]|nr:hypothetical protein MCOR02_012056 [Pyricularia oryzae]KAI6305839.1 hypothetical protein MCOR34_008330 [Pyricularia oryzae]KAI6478887.1 hypothetical protein MCOR13_011624 [Pyricularia oryzae]KAI6627960.1 hypothetical protein MCOR14_008583 [Pyricularia oryzae]